MQIVIDIPEKTYKTFKKLSMIIGVLVYEKDTLTLIKAVKNGIPLPKGHGRLIDANSLLEYGACPNSCNGTTTCTESYEHLHCPIRVFDIESINDTPTVVSEYTEDK